MIESKEHKYDSWEALAGDIGYYRKALMDFLEIGKLHLAALERIQSPAAALSIPEQMARARELLPMRQMHLDECREIVNGFFNHLVPGEGPARPVSELLEQSTRAGFDFMLSAMATACHGLEGIDLGPGSPVSDQDWKEYLEGIKLALYYAADYAGELWTALGDLPIPLAEKAEDGEKAPEMPAGLYIELDPRALRDDRFPVGE